MAKASRIDQDLFDRLRKSGLRKSVARQLATAGKAANDRAPARLRQTVSDLTDVLGDLERRVTGSGGTRSAAAKKAAATRKRQATKRSTAAKKGAATRARSSSSRSSGTRRSTSTRGTGSRRSTSSRSRSR